MDTQKYVEHMNKQKNHTTETKPLCEFIGMPWPASVVDDYRAKVTGHYINDCFRFITLNGRLLWNDETGWVK